jgi:putative flippase GtrA
MLRDLSKRSEFAGFVVAGGLAAGTNFGSRILLSQFVSYPVAIVLAYLAGMVAGFMLMRGSVFRSSGKRLEREVGAFVIVNVLAVLQTLTVSLVLAYYALPWMGIERHAETVGHFIGIAVPVVTSFFGHRHWTFRAR